MPRLTCRYCNSENVEHGDHCGDCGCPKCGFPGALHENRGFCNDCGWEAVSGAYKSWKDRQPVRTGHQMWREIMEAFGEELPPDDEVGQPIFKVQI